MGKVAYIKCYPSEENFTKLFNWIEKCKTNGYININENSISFSCFEVENEFLIKDKRKDCALIEQLQYGNCSESACGMYFDNMRVVIDVLIPNDHTAIDTFSFRYLILLKNQMLAPNDIIVISCNDTFYWKVCSFFCLEYYNNNKSAGLYASVNSEVKNFSFWFNPSSEWLPAMSFKSNEKEDGFYNLLSMPLVDKESFIVLYKQYKKEENDFKKLIAKMANMPLADSNFYKFFFVFCVFYWMEKFDERVKFFLLEEISSISTLALLIFTIQLKYRSKFLVNGAKKYALNDKALKRCLNVSLDFSEGLLQIIENVTCHTQGGCFLFRINDNIEKLCEEINYNDLDFSSYIRIAVIDYSKEGIVGRIRRKNRIQPDLSLKEIFNFKEIRNPEYRDYLLSEDSTVHHYGLQIFNSIVLQHNGCFVVKSNGKAEIDTDFDFCDSSSEDGFRLKNPEQVIINHVPGTEYNISLPLVDIHNFDTKGIPSFFSEDGYDTESTEKVPVFKTPICNFFVDGVSKIVKEIVEEREFESFQYRKEETVNISANLLSTEIEKYDDQKSVFYFYLDNDKMPFKRPEIIAKVLLKTFLNLNKKHKKINVVLYGLSESGIRNFVRQFSLFYRNGFCRYMEDNQIFLVSKYYETEILLYGCYLQTSYKFLCTQRFRYGASSNIAETLKYIVTNFHNCEYMGDSVKPIDYDILRRIELVNGEPRLSSTNKKWFYFKLKSVINSDIHGNFLGCKMENTHVRVNNVHIDTFYECRLLFGNPFWCRMFSSYLSECILNDDDININKPIILYGYETYSEQLLLFIKKNIMNVKKDARVEYIIFENSKYITSHEKSRRNIRYLDRTYESLGEEIADANYIFINGISTTLSTFREQLYNQLINEFKSKIGLVDQLKKTTKVGFVIIQVVDTSKNSVANDYIEFKSDSKTKDIRYVQSKKGYLDFIKNKQCGYLITAHSKWYAPEKCKMCQPEDFIDEKYLVETNDTSTVPMILIKPSETRSLERSEQYNVTAFLDDIKNQKYLYYGHLNRGDNHYQFYIRTAHYVQDHLNNESELSNWLKTIKEKETSGDKNTINILISPEHFSNATLISSVNEYVFNNHAHVITISTKKEFRESFEAKFNHYRTMIELIKQDLPNIQFTLNFYYVDDQLVTGAHYYRTRSLIKGLVENEQDKKTIEPLNYKINVFKAAIILVNRNSNKTINNFDLPAFYSFINLYTPSIRSYGDSCPICQEVLRLDRIINESSLFSTEKYWWERSERYAVHTLQEAKNSKVNEKADHNVSIRYKMKYEYKGFIRLQCSEEIWKCLRQKCDSANAMKHNIENCMLLYLKKTLSKERILDSLSIMMYGGGYLPNKEIFSDYRVEYLISFLKVLSRPPVIYQENVNSAILQILLGIYSLYTGEPKTKDLYMFVHSLLETGSRQVKYDLYRVVISCLCSLSSNLFWRDNGLELNNCFDIGINLEEGVSDFDGQDVPFDIFLRSQLKKNMYSNKDTSSKVSLMEGILLSRIEEELDNGSKT